MNNATIIAALDALNKKYMDHVLILGFHHLLSVGAGNLTADAVEQAKAQIHENDTGKGQIMTPEFSIAILECAADLAKLDYGALWRNAHIYIPDPDKYDVKPLPLEQIWTMDGKPAFIVTADEYHNRWRIIRVAGIVTVENAPMNESGYGTNWVAYDHEPPREAIENWLYSLQDDDTAD